MLVTRPPRPALRPFVKLLWASTAEEPRAGDAAREIVLPTGNTHVVYRLSDRPLRVFDDIADATGRALAPAVVGGARARYHVRDVSRPVGSVGAELQPGAAALLFALPAGELAGRHTPLADLWGRSADEGRERLAEAGRPERQIEVLEALLAARLPRVRALHPAVAHALERLGCDAGVARVVEESGYSHRRFLELFRAAVGLTPKVYSRVLRFRQALARIARPGAALADAALRAGYADQPHFNHEFREIAGISPGRYRAAAPRFPSHVPVASPSSGEFSFLQDRGAEHARMRPRKEPP